jgi:aminocarboxymuconate-semialdehyde decarboxylase
MALPDFPTGMLAALQARRSARLLGVPASLVLHRRARDPRSQYLVHSFWAEAEDLGVLVFLHPQGVPDLAKRLKGNGLPTNVIGNPLETTIALSHLIFEGTLDRFPGLKLCAAHGGRYLPSYSARSDHGCLTFPDRCSGMPLKKQSLS